ncbi:MAG: hypothetical protein P9M13_10970 [Candidatus Ancaeobacter aquaticus]|nr:hypothetical protein [Candidatus Ancaeobacter aquaticus]
MMQPAEYMASFMSMKGRSRQWILIGIYASKHSVQFVMTIYNSKLYQITSVTKAKKITVEEVYSTNESPI